MTENNESLLKGLDELRELTLKGSDVDSQKFNALAKSLLWDMQSSFSLPMSDEQMEFIKILTTSEAGGEYWKGYGDALTTFLLPVHRSLNQAPFPQEKGNQLPAKSIAETKLPPPRVNSLEPKESGEFEPILD